MNLIEKEIKIQFYQIFSIKSSHTYITINYHFRSIKRNHRNSLKKN